MSVKRIVRHECERSIPRVLYRVIDKSDYTWNNLDSVHLIDMPMPEVVVFARALQVAGWRVIIQLPSRDGEKHCLTIRRSHKKKVGS